MHQILIQCVKFVIKLFDVCFKCLMKSNFGLASMCQKRLSPFFFEKLKRQRLIQQSYNTEPKIMDSNDEKAGH